MNNQKGILVLAVMLALGLLTTIVMPSIAAADPANATVYFEPAHIEGGEKCNYTYAKVMVNASVKTGGIGMRIYFDPECVNITAVDFTGSPYQPPFPPYWTHRGDSVKLGGIGNADPGVYLFANLTLHCECESNCTSELRFAEKELVDQDGNFITDVEWYDGTYTCGKVPAPGIEVNKTVYDPETGKWVEGIQNARIGDIYRFRCEVRNTGNVNLSDIRLWDIASCSLEYAGNMTICNHPVNDSMIPPYPFKPRVLHPLTGWEPEQPLGVEFEELCPEYGKIYNLSSWEDTNRDGRLNYCDQIDMTDLETGEVSWYHVERLPYTLMVIPGAGVPVPVFLDSREDYRELNLSEPVGTQWEEVCNCRDVYELVNWTDDGDGVLGSADIIQLRNTRTGETAEYYVSEVAIDLVLSQEVRIDEYYLPGFNVTPPYNLTPYPPYNRIIIEADARVVGYGNDTNLQCAKGMYAGNWVMDCDEAWVNTPAMPDLVITDKYETLQDDGNITVTYTVANIGEGDAGASNTTITVDGVSVEDPAPALSAGESYTNTVGPFPCPCGRTVRVEVCADNDNEVEESNETNNCEVNEYECPPCPKPDLVVNKSVSVKDGVFIVSYTVSNIGEGSAGNSTTCMLIDGEPVQSQPCPALGSGESYSSTFEPEECPCNAILNVTVCADCEDVVEESNERNNCESNIVQCPIPGIEVNKTVFDTATGEWRDETTANLHDIVRFRGVIHNNGECPLSYIRVTDMLSDSLEYADNATVDGEPCEPELTPEGYYVWTFDDRVLMPCENITIEFDARAVRCGVDINTMNVSATYWYPVPMTPQVIPPEVYDSDTATVVISGIPSIEVDKTVWDQVSEEWVDELTAPVGETVTFNSTVHNDGECCTLQNITVTDTLSTSMRYVNATPEPEEVVENPDGTTVLIWHITALAPSESRTFIINATLTETGDDTNVQNATGWCNGLMATDEDTATVHSVRPEGGIGVAVLPRFNPVHPGDSVNLTIKVVNKENFGDVFLVRLTNTSIPAGWRADLAWFNWTSTYVRIPAGGEALIPLRADIPPDASTGYKAFRAVASSTKWTPSAFDTGVFYIT